MREFPIIANDDGSRRSYASRYSAGISFRLVKSPCAPKITIAHSGTRRSYRKVSEKGLEAITTATISNACFTQRVLPPARGYNRIVQTSRLTAVALIAAALQAAPAIFPLKDIKAGQRGVGRTVFSGPKVEEFQVEILGVLENIGPKQSIILARLSGGPLAKTGVMQGMSGSPVYIDGKLAGAVALGFPMATEPIAGIRPIEEMLRVDPDPKSRASRPQPLQAGNARLEELATPISFSGFTSATLRHFSAKLKELGMDPLQGVAGGGNPSDKLGDPSRLEPGSMISVQLMTGDLSVGADGTVTAIDGGRVYAFGHRFLAAGTTELPFARAEVLALLPNLSASFKISAAREWMGSITEDRNTAISGVMGRRAPMIPIQVNVAQNKYKMTMIQDRVMTPLLAQMAVFSSIDATERSVGPATYAVRGRIDFDAGSVRLDNVYGGDVSVAAIASMGVAMPLAYGLASGFDALKLKNLVVDVSPVDKRAQLQIADVAAPRRVRPGDDIELIVGFTGENGAETSKNVHYRLPVGAPPGLLYVTASDAAYTNMLELQSATGTPVHSAAQVIDFLNNMRSSTKAYVRLWRVDPAYTIEGRDLPDPPPSLGMIFSRLQSNQLNWRGSKVAEIEIPSRDAVVTGSRTIQIEVKE